MVPRNSVYVQYVYWPHMLYEYTISSMNNCDHRACTRTHLSWMNKQWGHWICGMPTGGNGGFGVNISHRHAPKCFCSVCRLCTGRYDISMLDIVRYQKNIDPFHRKIWFGIHVSIFENSMYRKYRKFPYNNVRDFDVSEISDISIYQCSRCRWIGTLNTKYQCSRIRYIGNIANFDLIYVRDFDASEILIS